MHAQNSQNCPRRANIWQNLCGFSERTYMGAIEHVKHVPIIDRILAPCNYCHHHDHPWCVSYKSYHKALLIMFDCDGISDHAIWNEVFHYLDTKLSWRCDAETVKPVVTCFGILLFQPSNYCLGSNGPQSTFKKLSKIYYQNFKTHVPSNTEPFCCINWYLAQYSEIIGHCHLFHVTGLKRN